VAVKLLGELEALPRLFRPSRKHAPLNLAIMPSLTGHEIRAFLRRLTDPVDAPALRLVELSEPADARLVSDRLVQDHEHFVPLWNEKFVLALPHGHPLTLKPKIRLADLQGARMIERCHCELHDEVAGALARYRIAVDVVAKAQNDEWALALTTAGLGVSFLPADSVAERHGVVVREIEDLHLVRRIGLAYDAKAPLSSALQAVIEAYGNRGPGRKSRTAQTIEGK
jgi:DNA-binding transcriptional LysR family regulator